MAKGAMQGANIRSNLGFSVFSILLKDTSTCSLARGAGIWTRDLPITRQHTLPPRLQPLHRIWKWKSPGASWSTVPSNQMRLQVIMLLAVLVSGYRLRESERWLISPTGQHLVNSLSCCYSSQLAPRRQLHLIFPAQLGSNGTSVRFLQLGQQKTHLPHNKVFSEECGWTAQLLWY